jgi:hypothetical protein
MPVVKLSWLYQHKHDTEEDQTQEKKGETPSLSADASQKQGHSGHKYVHRVAFLLRSIQLCDYLVYLIG